MNVRRGRMSPSLHAPSFGRSRALRRAPRTLFAFPYSVGGIGAVTPRDATQPLGSSAAHSLADYKNWNREPALLKLDWYKCADGKWCRLDAVETKPLQGYGVFVIWKNGSGAKVSAVLYVGRGALRDGLVRCRRDPIFHHPDGIYVTWAAVSDLRLIDEIGAYLYQRLRPVWGDVVLSSNPLPVTLPVTA